MERPRHRKTKSASGIEGIRQIQKQKIAPRLSTDSRSYIDGSNRDNMIMLEGVTGIPMKKLLAEEMSKDGEAKRRSPSIVAKLMGLEGLPSPRHVQRQQKRISINKKNNQMFDGRANRRSTIEQQEFKDVYEDLEASHAANRRSSSSILTKPELALIRQKFIDAKRLSTDENFQNSKELDDTLEMLDSNKDLLLKFLGQTNPLFIKHFHDLQAVDSGSHIAVLKPLNSEKYESKSKAWRSDRDREDGLLLEPHSRHRAQISRSSSSIQMKEKKEEKEKVLPTRIVVLKPNPGKIQNVGTSCSSPSPYSLKNNQGISRRRKESSNKAREIAQEITMRMIEGYDETTDAKSTAGRGGYVGDESSYDVNESDSDTESDVFKFKLSSRRSCSDESSANKEAKKRLSERWKMTHKYQDLEMVNRASTLAEMLSLPDKETRNSKTNSDNRAKNRGISSRDGWKDEIYRNSSRSRSVPPGGRGRISRRSSSNDKLSEDKKNLVLSDSARSGRSKASKDSTSRRKKSSRSYENIFSSEIDNFEIQMEANTKELCDKQSTFHMPEKVNICEIIPEVDVMVISENGSTTMSPKTPEQPPCDIAASHNEEDFNLQEMDKGTPIQESPSPQCKEAEHPSPNSVLEVTFTEDTSPSESFERVGAELHELRMQLQLLKMESGTCAESSTLHPIDEEEEGSNFNYAESSPTVSDINYENWKYSYAVDVLIYSGFEDSTFDEFKATWQSPDTPLDPKLFDHLEKKYNNDDDIITRPERKLLFDHINSSLLESFDFRPWVTKSGGLISKCVKDDVRDAVEKFIDEEFSIKEITDKELDQEIMWSDSREVIEEIGNEIEKLLIDDMISEVICCN